MELFQLFGTIAINNALANKEIDETTDKAEKSSGKIGTAFKKIGTLTVKAMAAATTAAATGIAAVTKAAVSSYADYEQLVGGVETLFKDSAGKVLNYADNAYKTAGLSANKYMETVTSFSASLLQGLGGDTAKAAEVADLAITDMADNANKMGTSMESIQDAYQGFAKQNYTMLDNLKLGYGGTQTEMIRLINDSGVLEKKISSLDGVTFDQMIMAIHKVQDNMGITGTTAKEAATTIQGAIASAKGAWENFLVGLADGDQDMKQLTKNLGDSILTVGDNLIPRIQTTLQSIGTLIETIVPPMLQKLPSMLMQILPSLLSSAVSMVKSIGSTLLTALQNNLPQIMQSGADMINKLGEGIKNNLPNLINNALDIILNLTTSLRDNAPQLIQSGLNLIVNLAKGLMDSLPSLIAKVPTIVSNIAGIINDNAPKLLVTAGKLILTLAKGLIQAIPTLVSNIPKIIKAVVDAFLAFNWLSMGKSLITKIKNGFVGENPVIAKAAKKVLETIVNAIKALPQRLFNLGKQAIRKLATIIKHTADLKTAANAIVTEIAGVIGKLPAKMLSIGKNLVKGLWNGIGNAKDWIISKVKGFGKGILDGLKSFFGIHSPSKVMEDQVGKNLALGVANGITKNAKYAKKSAAELGQLIVDAAYKKLDKYQTYNDMTLAAEVEFWNRIRKQCKKGTDARLQADKEYYAAKESLNQQLVDLEKEYQNAIDAASQKIVDRTNQILQAFSLFDTFEIKIDEENPITGDSLISSLDSQVNALDDWTKEISALKGKMGDTELFKAIQEMGVSSLAQVKAINSMTEEQLQQYVDLYNKRQELAKEQATSELGAEVVAEMQEAYKTYKESVEALGATVKKKYKDIDTTITNTMKNTDKITSEKMNTMVSTFKNGTKSIANVIETKFSAVANTIASKMRAAVDSVKAAVAEAEAAAGSAGSQSTTAASESRTTSTRTTGSSRGGIRSLYDNVTTVKKNAEGGILTRPTIFGYTPSTGQYQMGGEAGDEAIAPIDTLQGYVAEAVASQNAELVAILKSILKVLKSLNLSVELDGKEIAKNVNKRLGVVY